jgi:hypothetical protein
MASFIIMYFPPGYVHFFCGYAHHDYCLHLSIQRLHTGEKPLYNLHKGYKFAYLIADTSVDRTGTVPLRQTTSRLVLGPNPTLILVANSKNGRNDPLHTGVRRSETQG